VSQRQVASNKFYFRLGVSVGAGREEQTLMTDWTPMSMKMGFKDIFEINLA
jgi:hypothetical protein